MAKTTKKQESKVWGVSSLVCGILSIIGFIMPYFSIPLAIMAIVFSGVQRKKCHSEIATGGLVTGIIGLVIGVCVSLLVAVVLSLGF